MEMVLPQVPPCMCWQQFLRYYQSHAGGCVTSGITRAMAVAFPQALLQPRRWSYLEYHDVCASSIPSGIIRAMLVAVFYQRHGGGISSGITRAMVVAFPQALPEPWTWCYLRYYQSHGGGVTSGITAAMAALPQILPQPQQRHSRGHSHSHGGGSATPSNPPPCPASPVSTMQTAQSTPASPGPLLSPGYGRAAPINQRSEGSQTAPFASANFADAP